MDSCTIVIPCFDAGAHLSEAVASARAQTHPHTDIIVVDDGSSDPLTLSVLDQLRGEGIRVLDQPNRGPGAARNAGIAAATSTYVLPLDADDRLSPNYVAAALDALRVRPGILVAHGMWERFGAARGRIVMPPFSPGELAVDCCVHVSGLFRRESWERAGGFNEELPAVEDYDFWIRMCKLGGDFVQVPEATLFYRIGRNMVSRRVFDVDARAATYARIHRDHLDFFAEHADDIYRFRFNLAQRHRDLTRRFGVANRGIIAVRRTLGRALRFVRTMC